MMSYCSIYICSLLIGLLWFPAIDSQFFPPGGHKPPRPRDPKFKSPTIYDGKTKLVYDPEKGKSK